MKIKGSIINGLFQFIPGIPYTRNSIILYNLHLYIVISDVFEGKVTPDKSRDCMSYIEYHSYSSTNQSPTALITSLSIYGIIKKYFKGLTGSGSLETISIYSIADLDKYSETGAFKCVIQSEFLGVIPAGEYLLRIYKTNNDTIQELLDYSTGLIIIRVIESNRIFILPSSKSENQSRLTTPLLNITQRINNIVDIASNLKETAFNYQTIEFNETSPKTYLIGGLEKDTILHMIFFDVTGDEVIQYSKEIYLTDLTKDLKISFTELDYLRSNFDNGELRIELTSSNFKLIKCYISKGNS